jgi:hypothetical protein
VTQVETRQASETVSIDADRIVSVPGPEPASRMACILCASIAYRPYWGDELVQCMDCSLVRADDRFFACDPRALYGAGYYSGPGGEYADYRGERSAARRNGRQRVNVLRRLAPAAERLFEIGCGYGYFLELAAAHWSSAGIEVSVHAAGEAQRLNVRCVHGDYLTTPAVHPAPQIVCLWDTIEHLVAPRKVLEKIAAEVPPGAIVAVSTGDIASWLPQRQRERWRLIHPPTHLWYFSVPTLTKLFQDTGFSVVRVAHPPFYRSLRLYLRRFASYLPEAVGDFAVPLQTWDLMEIYVRRDP